MPFEAERRVLLVTKRAIPPPRLPKAAEYLCAPQRLGGSAASWPHLLLLPLLPLLPLLLHLLLLPLLLHLLLLLLLPLLLPALHEPRL